MARRGRRGALTPPLFEQLLEHLRAGLWNHNAAELIGVSPGTLEMWITKGREELSDATDEMDRTGKMPTLGRYAQLVVSMNAIKAQTEAQMMGVVREVATLRGPDVVAADGTKKPGPLLDPSAALKASTWWLERRNNLQYGRGALRVGVDLQPPHAGVPDDDDDPADLMLEKLDVIEQNVRAVSRPPDVSSASTHE